MPTNDRLGFVIQLLIGGSQKLMFSVGTACALKGYLMMHISQRKQLAIKSRYREQIAVFSFSLLKKFKFCFFIKQIRV